MDDPKQDLQQIQCRLCLDGADGQELIVPCLCSGGSKYVHRACLDRWRATRHGPRTFDQCEVCQFVYVIDDKLTEEHTRMQLYRLALLRDFVQVLGVALAIVSAVSAIVWLFDRSNSPYSFRILYHFCNPDTCGTGALVYFIIGLAICLAVVGIIGSVGGLNTPTPPPPPPPPGAPDHLPRPENNDDVKCLPANHHNHDAEWAHRRLHIWHYHHYHIPSPGGGGGGGGGGPTCTGCDCKGGNGNGKDGCAIILIIITVIVLAFAIVGLFFGIGYAIDWSRRRAQSHADEIWQIQEAQRLPVHDFVNEPQKLLLFKEPQNLL